MTPGKRRCAKYTRKHVFYITQPHVRKWILSFWELIKQYLNYCSVFWTPLQHMTDTNMWIQWQATKAVGTGALAPWGEAEGAWLFQPARRMGLGTPRSSLPDSLRKLSRGQSWAIPKGALQEEKQLTREGQSVCQEKIFQHEDSPVLKQAYQEGCAVSILGGFQDPTG